MRHAFDMTTKTTPPLIPSDTLAHRLVLLRLELGWSQREAAKRTGIPYGQWQSMENGRDARSIDAKVAKISETTGYDRDWLMWGGTLRTKGFGCNPYPFGAIAFGRTAVAA